MNSEQMMIFSEERCKIILPGMVNSIRHLIEYSESEQGRHFQWGYITSAIILAAHAAELLLKYKLEREGKSFDRIHDLYCLYEQLEDKSKVEIQKQFDKLVSEANVPPNGLPDGWDSAESVFRSARKAHEEWRYLVETNPRRPRESPVIEPSALYTAVLSVFRTTPLRGSINTFETMAIEDIPDPDVRTRALNYMNREPEPDEES